jgi:transposase InsO family protein
MDFVSDQLATGRWFRVFNLADDFTRECVGQIVDFSISGQRVAWYLDEVSTTRKLPGEFVLDNGPEMTSKALWFWSQRRDITLSFIRPGKAMENPFVESFNGKLRDECLYERPSEILNVDIRTVDANRNRRELSEITPLPIFLLHSIRDCDAHQVE